MLTVLRLYFHMNELQLLYEDRVRSINSINSHGTSVVCAKETITAISVYFEFYSKMLVHEMQYTGVIFYEPLYFSKTMLLTLKDLHAYNSMHMDRY